MLATRVPSLLLAPKRLDPDYYRPEHIRDERILREFGSVELRETGKFFAGPFGSALPSELYLASGVPLFRVGNVGEMTVIYDGMAHLDEAVHHDLIASEVRPGDLLIVKASVGEKICVVPDWIPRANITQHIIAIHPNGSHDTEFVAAFLFTPYGRRQLERRSLGSIIQYLGVTDAKDVLLPELSSDGERYVGEKVRQAEGLREAGKALARRVAASFNEYFSHYSPAPMTRGYRVRPERLNGRVDAWYHNPRFVHAEAAIRKSGTALAFLGALYPGITNGGTPGDARFGAVGVPWIRGQDFHDGDIYRDTLPRMDTDSEETIKRSRLAVGDLVISIKGTVGDAAAIDEELRGCNINQDIARVPIRDLATADFVAAFCESNLGQVLIEQQVYGAINAFFSLENLRVFPVPDPASVSPYFFQSVSSGRRQSIDLRRTAVRLTTASKQLVEALIEGRVTEAELAAAQQALDRGDTAPDRALLSRLTRAGFDLPGDPLFPDIETLYGALQQSDQPQAT
ncbi:hypothetical protein CfE428DRAFT_1283 [Chthoniobacter flavus Ellin428]|uniref:Type I restriction modification DNA specificity domain-containing protein n=1 Tax=Chthoniobacter flavus Ellin428 TaxID=497964 RepID=B4CXJ2_9BACT|nr:hypothetical protein [Chthoniobacter flavus]EDY20990.1 hypothetical protein CfE428DRAFT_1283 [Chthoniobacter flavus Ellin428]TCO88717.1 hypothetical protein EV701_11689 [Chthoniobacter flavus]